MIKRRWTIDDLVFTDKGFSILYKEGQVIDRLIVMEYVGKHHVPSRDTWCPVYRCLCDCGNQEYRTQEYLSRRKKNGRARHKWCDKCANNATSTAMKKRNAERYDHAKDATEGYVPEKVEFHLNQVWFTGGPVYD